jgi:peptidoglycan/LPS O-acetylase OafA/YrhL
VDDRAVSRIYYVDWLRILAVLLLFPFHTLRVFNNEPFYVKGAYSDAVSAVLGFINVWHMPLLFFLAGASTFLAMRKRTGRQYGWERVKRLLVPLVFGTFVLIPPQTWTGARFNSGYTGSYWEYLSSGDFLEWNIQEGGDYYGGFGLGQLWFILWLFVISLVVLPLVLWGARGRGLGRMQSFSRRLSRPIWWTLAVVILFVAEAVPELADKPTVLYLAVFLLGYVAMCDPRFADSAERYRIPALVGGVALTLFWVLSGDFRDSLPDPGWGRAGLAVLGGAALWLMVMGAMGLGKRYLDRTSRAERYLAEGSYPIYIIHQTMIVLIAFYLVDLAIPWGVQCVILLILAVAATFALYELARRVSVFRFLLGMRQRRRAPQTVETTLKQGGDRPLG